MQQIRASYRMSPEHISVDVWKFEFNLGSNWKIKCYLIDSNLAVFKLAVFKNSLFDKWIIINNSPTAFTMIGWIGRGELEELIQKNTCNSKIVIPLSDISILEGAEIRYKSKKYPKGFWNSYLFGHNNAKTLHCLSAQI